MPSISVTVSPATQTAIISPVVDTQVTVSPQAARTIEVSPLSNNIDLSNYLTRNESGQFYPRSNPSGFTNSTGGAGGAVGVSSLNELTGQLNLSGYGNISISNVGTLIKISGSEFTPIGYNIYRSGDIITGLIYLNGMSTVIFRSGEYITGVNDGVYLKAILYDLELNITGVRYSLL